MSTQPPTIDDQITWMRELIGFQRRQYGTLVETGRMTEDEAQRKWALCEAVLATLEAARPNAATVITAAGRAGQLKTPTAEIKISCGAAFEHVALMNCALFLTQNGVRSTLMMTLASKLDAVIASGIRRAAQ